MCPAVAIPRCSPWIKTFAEPVPARWRLLCCPYAGGSAGLFRTWPRFLPADVELLAVQYPGREERLREPAFTSLAELSCSLAQELGPLLADKPFAIFGHSLGALVAFELTRQLRATRNPLPLQLFVSGACGPRINTFKDRPRHRWADEAFLQELRRIDGTPPELLANTELMALLLPTLRADLAVVDTYFCREEALLDVPVHAFGGLDDLDVSPESLEAWQEETHAAFAMTMFAGNHFFLHQQAPLLCELIAGAMDSHSALRRDS